MFNKKGQEKEIPARLKPTGGREFPAPNKRSTGFPLDFRINQPPPQDPTGVFSPYDLVLVRVVKGTKSRPFRGPVTGIMYGYYGTLGEFKMHEADFEHYMENPNTWSWLQELERYEAPPVFNLTSIPGIGEKTADKLLAFNIDSKEKLYKAGVEGMVQAGIAKSTAKGIYALLNVEFEGELEDEEEDPDEDGDVSDDADDQPSD